ncbi:hypothetical protein SAMN05216203_3061 [Marinobacter daqiaonensis]|uniref:Uncharacterized protein n=1 Tax=Marinobacter daqiaonensis TaxID=650891 RepID=A0A1I6JMT1_9GAMM|nr:hypothetical protein [Marinobacter daqiaonensis]SFR80264.1 hypothetical protein SAMN05216203_3061 [Marinobacter daqiaonensis]
MSRAFTATSKSAMLALMAAVTVTSCVSSEQAAEQIATVDSDALLNREASNWERPFWETDSPRREQDEEESRSEPLESAIREARNRTYEVPAGILLENIAVIGAPSSVVRNMGRAAPDYGFRIIPPADTSEALNRIEACGDTTSLACAEAMAAYPGARLVITVSNNEQATIVDAASGASWGNIPLDGPDLAGEILDMAVARTEIAPWAMKPFLADDGRLYLSAGRANGVEPGMEFAVHEPGTLVRSPNGQPVTWRKGERIGTVRIGELYGSDLASLAPVQGQRPTPEHDLILIEE